MYGKKTIKIPQYTLKCIFQVLSCDFRPDGQYIASCGMDHSILVWNIASERATMAMEAASGFKLQNCDKPFPTVTLPPIFSTRDVHSNYIDCVRWFGDYLLSKSCENEIKVKMVNNNRCVIASRIV